MSNDVKQQKANRLPRFINNTLQARDSIKAKLVDSKLKFALRDTDMTPKAYKALLEKVKQQSKNIEKHDDRRVTLEGIAEEIYDTKGEDVASDTYTKVVAAYEKTDQAKFDLDVLLVHKDPCILEQLKNDLSKSDEYQFAHDRVEEIISEQNQTSTPS